MFPSVEASMIVGATCSLSSFGGPHRRRIVYFGPDVASVVKPWVQHGRAAVLTSRDNGLPGRRLGHRD